MIVSISLLKIEEHKIENIINMFFSARLLSELLI